LVLIRHRASGREDLTGWPQKAEFKRAYPTPSEYKLGDFKKEVQSWLFNNYAGDLDSSGKRALRIKANCNRRSSDILLVAPHECYSRYVSEQDKTVREGVLFITSGGTKIVNRSSTAEAGDFRV
jgi:hypothetical protein